MQTRNIKRVYTFSFLFSLHIAISAYINSTFLAEIINENYVGTLYTVSAILTLFFLAKTSKILSLLGNKKFILILLVLNILSLVGLIIAPDQASVILSFIIFQTTNTLVFFSLDIFAEHFTDPARTGRIRGFYLTCMNIAWMLSPLITGFILKNKESYGVIYLVALITVVIMAIGVILFINKDNFVDKPYVKKPFIETYRFITKNKHMLAIIMINFLLQFFYVWMVIYTPLYLHQHMNFTWGQIGAIFTIMLSPFVILGIPIGKLIDNYGVSKRTLLIIGVIIISTSTITIAFLSPNSLVLWALVLFTTRIGAAIIETTSEIYLFTHIKEEEAYLLSIYRDMAPFAYIIAPIVATSFLSIFEFKFIFITLGLIMLTSLYYVPKLKHNHGV